MKVVCARKDLLEGVQVAARAVGTRTSLPILGHLLIRAEDDRLRIAATDLEIGMECIVQATVESPGSFTVPAKTLQEILSTLPEAEVSLTVDEHHAVSITGGMTDCTLLGLPPEEFPVLSDANGGGGFTIDRSALRDGIRKTIFAASTDDYRASSTGTLITSTDDGIRLVSVDGRRLCVKDCMTEKTSGEITAVVPSRAMSELLRIIPDADGVVTANVSDSQIVFNVDDTILVSRLIDSQFPAYEGFIPKESNRRLIIPREQFLQSVRMASVVARDNANRTVLKAVDNKLTVSAESSGVGKVCEVVDAACKGEAIEIAFNCKFIIDVLAAMDDEAVVMELSEPLGMGVIRPHSDEGYTYVVAPMHNT